MTLDPVVDYFEKTVKPTVNEFLKDKTDIRRGRIAAIVLYHMDDYVRENGYGNPTNSLLGSDKMLYQAVKAAANATKHFRLRKEHIAMAASQVIAEDNPGLFDAPFGEGVFAESNEVHLELDKPETIDGLVYEKVNLATAITFIFGFWEQKIINFEIGT